MCSAPEVEKPQQYQTSKAPIYRTGGTKTQSSGRRGTILSGNTGQQQEISPTSKKTVLGM